MIQQTLKTVEKRQFFDQNKQISPNRQFVALDGIICFSVRFYNNSLLKLEMFSGLFFRKQKGTKVFQ